MSRVWFSSLNDVRKAEASRAWLRLLKDYVAKMRSRSDAIVLFTVFAAISEPHSSTKSCTWVMVLSEMLPGIRRTSRWLRLRSSTILSLKWVLASTSRFDWTTLTS